ncbi:MAG: PRD domain-containing protein [Liquorilactobacillus ghanensis]|uniref:BglG family transcription antiterminator n=3 Tax=Liquorilactobacillus ghanensis TaxID=399370 RepID=UPI0039E7E21E
MNSADEMTYKMIRFILANSIVHYGDLMEFSGLSRKTIAKYLDDIQKMCPRFDVKLVRKRNVGIYFEGNTNKIAAEFKISLNKVDIESREMQILEFLLKLDHPILLDDLADNFFISRNTLIRDLKKLKNKFEIEITSSTQGIYLDQKQNKNLTAKVIKKFGVATVKQKAHDAKFVRNFNIPTALTKYIDKENLEIIQKVLADFVFATHLDINEYEYESLLIHATLAIQRIENGKEIYKDQLIDQKAEIIPETLNLVQLLEKNFQCQIPENEIEYLNIHIIAIKSQEISITQGSNFSNNLTSFLKESIDDFDDLLIKNLIIHLIPAIKRCKLKIYIKNPYVEQIKVKFPVAVDQATKLVSKLQKEYKVIFNEDEICYLALHFESFIERKSKNKQEIKIAIVCSTGFGTAVLLKQQLKEHFPKISTPRLLSVQELIENGVHADIILSTIPIVTKNIKVMQVSPFLNDKDLHRLSNLINELQQSKYVDNFFEKLIHVNCISIIKNKITREDAINILSKNLAKENCVTTQMNSAALEREKLSSTSLGIIAIPHGNIREVKKPAIGILSAKQGISWGEDNVKLCFFVALDKTVANKLDDIYSYFYDLIKDKEIVKQLINSGTPEELYDRIVRK